MIHIYDIMNIYAFVTVYVKVSKGITLGKTNDSLSVKSNHTRSPTGSKGSVM